MVDHDIRITASLQRLRMIGQRVFADICDAFTRIDRVLDVQVDVDHLGAERTRGSKRRFRIIPQLITLGQHRDRLPATDLAQPELLDKQFR